MKYQLGRFPFLLKKKIMLLDETEENVICGQEELKI